MNVKERSNNLYLKDFYQRYCIPRVGQHLYIPSDFNIGGGLAEVREVLLGNTFKDSTVVFAVKDWDKKEYKEKKRYNIAKLLEQQPNLREKFHEVWAGVDLVPF